MRLSGDFYISCLQARSQTTPIGGRLEILGGNIVSDHRTQLTIAITDSASTMQMGYKTMLKVERAERFFVCTPNNYCDILR